MVPAYALAGILLWRRAPWGYVLATVVLIGGLVQQVDYMTALAFQANANIPARVASTRSSPRSQAST